MIRRSIGWLALCVLLCAGCVRDHNVCEAPVPITPAGTASVTTEPTLYKNGAVEPYVTALENGITVVLVENHQAPIVAVRVYVRTGSMHEQEFLGAGVSHFLEHLVSGGTTPTRTEAESRDLLDAIGAQSNAYTTVDHTCYYMATSSRFLDDALNLLSDWVMNSSITQEEFDREYEVIQREMETRLSNPGTVHSRLATQNMFKVHPVRHPVIGYRNLFRQLKRDDVVAYYKRRYVPDNVLVVVGGDVEKDSAVDKIRTAFAEFERRPMPTIALPSEPPQLGPREVIEKMASGQAFLRMSYRTIPLTHPDLYPLDILSYILSSGPSSRLVQRLREERGLVSGINSWSYTPGTYDGGSFGIQATLPPEKLDAAKRAIVAELNRFKTELVSDEELKRAKRQKISHHVFGLQTVEAQASSVATDILSARDPNFSRLYVDHIQGVTAEKIRDAARKYFAEDSLSITVLRPPQEKTAAGKAPTTEGAGGSAIRKTLLPNGIRLLVKRNPAQPVVSIQAFFLGGVRLESAEKNGVSLFTARMMTRGTRTLSAQQIAASFDAMGGAIAGSSGNNSLYVSATCLAADFSRAMELSADVVRNPTFEEEEIERLRPQMIASVKRRSDNWHATLADHFRDRFFKTHPYRHSAAGTVASLEAIRRGDLSAFHEDFCRPSNMVLAVFGDVDPDDVIERANVLFSDWLPASKELPPAPSAEPVLTEDDEAVITTHHPLAGIMIGFPGLTIRDEKDRYAMDVLDAIVSGISLPRGWLHKELRGKEEGLVYEVHAFPFVGLEPGYFGIMAGCEPGRADEVKTIILQQIRRASTEAVADEEIQAARQTCVTADVLDRQTNAAQAMQSGLDELYGLGYDYSDRYAQGVLAVTAGDVKRVAQKYLQHYLCVTIVPEENTGDKP